MVTQILYDKVPWVLSFVNPLAANTKPPISDCDRPIPHTDLPILSIGALTIPLSLVLSKRDTQHPDSGPWTDATDDGRWAQ